MDGTTGNFNEDAAGDLVPDIYGNLPEGLEFTEEGEEEEEVFVKILKSKSNLRRLSPLPK